MKLHVLRYFVAVAEDLHFGRAALRLHISQPPLSQAILALEQELGVTLFARTRRSVTLTHVGAQWLPYARRLLADAAALPGAARRIARGEIGSLRLSFVSTADYSVLPKLISRYRAMLPAVDVFLKESTSDLQIADLLCEEIDAGIVISPLQSALHSSLAYEPLLREPLIAAVPENAPIGSRATARGGSARLRDVLALPLILFPRQSAPAFHDLITGHLAASGVVPLLGQQAIQMQTILSLVSAGMGVAIVPRSMRNLQRRGVRYLALRERTPQIETGLIWRRDDPSPTLRGFIEVASARSVSLRPSRPSGHLPKAAR